METNRQTVNRDLPKYSQISRIELVSKEFEKTPKRNIKRYRYV
jgi:long-chain acyl-CoA synthetase